MKKPKRKKYVQTLTTFIVLIKNLEQSRENPIPRDGFINALHNACVGAEQLVKQQGNWWMQNR